MKGVSGSRQWIESASTSFRVHRQKSNCRDSSYLRRFSARMAFISVWENFSLDMYAYTCARKNWFLSCNRRRLGGGGSFLPHGNRRFIVILSALINVSCASLLASIDLQLFDDFRGLQAFGA